MTKRLDVRLSEAELERYRAAAARAGVSLSAWVRRTLDAATDSLSDQRVATKLAALRRADAYSFPAPDIDQILVETERGYTGGLP